MRCFVPRRSLKRVNRAAQCTEPGTGWNIGAKDAEFDKTLRKCWYGRTRPAVTASCQKKSGVFPRT